MRPRTRGDCEDGPRPCPIVSCRYHMLLDVGEDGRLVKTRPFDEHDADSVAFTLLAMPETCSLDVAERGAHAETDIAEMLNLTRTHVADIETRTHRKLRRNPTLNLGRR